MGIHHRVLWQWRDRSAGVFVLLALLTLLPAGCVLWFMNDALERESAAAQQRVLESYRGQLRLVRARLDPVWRAEAARIEPHGHPEQEFARIVGEGLADGLVLLGSDGAVVYPDRAAASPPAVRTLEDDITAAAGIDPGARSPAIERIAARLNDYRAPLPAVARLRLMTRLRRLAANVQLPTQAALALSLDMVDAGAPAAAADSPGAPGARIERAGVAAIRQTAALDIWALTSTSGRAIAFYRMGRLESMMHDFLHQVAPAGITFIATPPDVAADSEAISAGSWLPGWQLTFVPNPAGPLNDGAERRRTLYVSVALAGIGLIAVVGLAVAGSVRRHLQVARLKTDLAAAASHELRTPLASMRVLVDGLVADETLDPVKTREYLELIARENARLQRVIENFLTFSRIDRRAHRFVFAPAHPSCIVETAAAAVRDRLTADCTLRVEVEPDLPLVMADAEAIGSALVNLLDNAIKYSPAPRRIVVRTRQDNDRSVTFAVEDNGIGIPAHERRRIFRRFYRVDRQLSGDTSGVGLGLSIVELVVRGHGGRVEVSSEPGAGSQFSFRLRCMTSEALPQSGEHAGPR